MTDMINHPPHYTRHPSGVECIQITRHMGFNLGNAVKYIWRADLKGAALDDLRKAAFYIADEIAKREAASNTPNEGLTPAAHIARRDAERAAVLADMAATDANLILTQLVEEAQADGYHDPQPLEWPAEPASAPPDGLSDVSATHAAESAKATPAARVCGGCRFAEEVGQARIVNCGWRNGWKGKRSTCKDWQPRSDLASIARRDAWQAQDSGVEL